MNDVDIGEMFLREIQKYTHKDAVIIDIGCGNNEFLGPIEKKLGIGIDEESSPGVQNTNFVLADADYIPFKDNCSHIVVARWSMEHLRNPTIAAREIHRVLDDAGVFIFTTPHRFHFASLAATAIPWNSLKSKLMGWRVYSTSYGFNTPAKISKVLVSTGFNEIGIIKTYEPTLTVSRILNILLWPFNYAYKTKLRYLLPPHHILGIFQKTSLPGANPGGLK